MTSPEIGRALQVCSTCKTRKKGCDKVLPTCGYCSKRSLPCRYTPLPEEPAVAVVVGDSTKHFWDPQALARNRNHLLSFESFTILRAASLPQTALLYDPFHATDKMAFGDMLRAYLSHILGCLNLPVAELCHCFFNGFHQWLPTISPGRFIGRAKQLPNGVLDAQDSVLLLAMCLIVLRPSLDSPVTSPHGLKNLYLTVKSCFAKTQAVLTTTIPLLQAGVLIAAYEYATRRAETAYVSIENCAIMANVLGLGRNQLQGDEDRPDPESTMKCFEESNVWWSIIVIERQVQEFLRTNKRLDCHRLVVAELTESQLPTTKFPANDCYLPSDLSYSHGHDAEAASGPHYTAPLGLLHSNNISGFGRQAQAISMLDESLRILGSSEASLVRLRATELLDERLQAFLILIMREYIGPGRQCGANAIVIRYVQAFRQSASKHVILNHSNT